ncbi:MAG: N-6 DNA methylase [Rubripirellula sp.]
MTVPAERTDEPKSVCDPACGSGRQLLAVAKHQPHWELIGQDIDHRAVVMTAINLGLNGLRGWAVHQNTLTLEVHRVYKIGFNPAGGVIADVPVERSPFSVTAVTNANDPICQASASELTIRNTTSRDYDDTASQLDLF